MKAKWKSKWIKALKSGEYKQARASLKKRGKKMCCLGVLCDVAGAKWVTNVGPYVGDIQIGNTAVLTHDGLKYFGLTAAKSDKLVDMNDTNGKTFEEIAEYIKKKL